MFDKEEKALRELGEDLSKANVPENIEEFIRKGIVKGKAKKKSLSRRLVLNIAAVFVFSVFIITIRVSPVAASYISKVPGLSYIVKLINYDKGIADAVKNDFVQRINISQEYEGLEVSIKDIIIDSSRAVLFYSIENKTDHKFVDISDVEFLDVSGKKLEYSNSRAGINKDMSIEKKFEGQIDLSFSEENIIPDTIVVNFKLKESDSNYFEAVYKELSSVWSFKVPIDKKKFEGMIKSYDINQTVEVEGQKITFKKLTATPTRIALDIEYDKNNTKKILSYDDLVILNEKGEKWGTIVNAFTGSLIDEYHTKLYLQSNFFTSPSKIYISFRSIKALDKDKLQVIIDTKNSKLIKSPDDKLSLISSEKQEKGTRFKFKIQGDEVLDKEYSYFVFNNSIKDASQNSYEHLEFSCSRDDKDNFIEILAPTEAVDTGAITLEIYDYPTRIKGEVEVRVK